MKLLRKKRVVFSLILMLTMLLAMIHVYKQGIGLVLRSKSSGYGLSVTTMPYFGEKMVLLTRNHSTSNKTKYNSKQILETLSNKLATQNIPSTPMATTKKPIYGNIQGTITQECIPTEDPSSIQTPFKFYIYDMPSKFNTDIKTKMSTAKDYAFCYNLNYCGMGEELYRLDTDQSGDVSTDKTESSDVQAYSVRNTHQFALETVIHHKLMHSPYRTLDPSKADMFYIPAYTGLTCLSSQYGGNAFVDMLFSYLRQNTSYFLNDKPHFSTLSKIQREQGSNLCGTLRHRDSANITYIAIEKESNPYWADPSRIYGNNIIVAPYPSYIHFIPRFKNSHLKEFSPNITDLIRNSKFRLQVPSLMERKVKLFLASSTRRSNPFRAKLIDQFKIQTDYDYVTYLQKNNISARDNVSDIMLKTPECSLPHRTTTIPWMLHSVFCLQPPGDSPTRKSFYDSILSGCIPIIFALQYPTEFPFRKYLDYRKFTVTIDEKIVTKTDTTVLDIIQALPEQNITALHDNLLRVAKWFQYSMNDGGVQQDTDAVTLILEQLREKYKL